MTASASTPKMAKTTNGRWLEFVLEADDQGVVTITVSGVSSLGSFAASHQCCGVPATDSNPHSHTCAPAQLRALGAAVHASVHGRADGCQPTRTSSLSLQGSAKRLRLRAHARTIPDSKAASLIVTYVPRIRLGPATVGADTDDRGSGDGSNWRRRDRRSSMDKEALVSSSGKVAVPESARLCASVVAPTYDCHY